MKKEPVEFGRFTAGKNRCRYARGLHAQGIGKPADLIRRFLKRKPPECAALKAKNDALRAKFELDTVIKQGLRGRNG